ncbi:MAG: DUF3450 domain-containing protein [Gammaproteobacteria bacterium]|nr:DUF3450 domain-containing protein [Gammaproteobacteria bacterium]MDH3507427.1 DUF3450 domain-containing protein [Gammaproteobacteria bacterium]
MIAKRNVVLLIGTLGAIFTAEMVAGQAVDQIVAAEERRIQQAQVAQDAIDEVVEETRDLTEEYRSVMKEVDGLLVYNTLLDRQIADQNRELDNLRTSIDSVTVIERQILPLLTRMIEGLERFVALDMPFLEEERTDRVDNLLALLERSDVTAAEKFRVVMEAWQIENEYGRTIEAYTGVLELDGNAREVDFLRIGRVALLYQTPDGQNSGAWDQAARNFVPVGNEFRNSIRQGLRLARNQVGPDLLLLPIAAPEEG